MSGLGRIQMHQNIYRHELCVLLLVTVLGSAAAQSSGLVNHDGSSQATVHTQVRHRALLQALGHSFIRQTEIPPDPPDTGTTHTVLHHAIRYLIQESVSPPPSFLLITNSPSMLADTLPPQPANTPIPPSTFQLPENPTKPNNSPPQSSPALTTTNPPPPTAFEIPAQQNPSDQAPPSGNNISISPPTPDILINITSPLRKPSPPNPSQNPDATPPETPPPAFDIINTPTPGPAGQNVSDLSPPVGSSSPPPDFPLSPPPFTAGNSTPPVPPTLPPSFPPDAPPQAPPDAPPPLQPPPGQPPAAPVSPPPPQAPAASPPPSPLTPPSSPPSVPPPFLPTFLPASPSTQPQPPPLPPVQTTPPPFAARSPPFRAPAPTEVLASSPKTGLSTTTIVAIAAGAAGGGLLAVAGLTAYLLVRKPTPKPPKRPHDGANGLDARLPPKDDFATAIIHISDHDVHKSVASRPGNSGVQTLMTARAPSVPKIAGFVPGDPFLRSTAPQYTWTQYVPGNRTVNIEAGINDAQLDKLSLSYTAKADSCPVIQLNRSEVTQQIELLSSGLLGRGATAMVFKARWPSRFGEHALLAVKVLKDAYDADPVILDSFAYEAGVLSSISHPNVVRIYGYCLDLPTVCLIMELLPGTLKDRLHPNQQQSRLASGRIHQAMASMSKGTNYSLGGTDSHSSGFTPADTPPTNVSGVEIDKSDMRGTPRTPNMQSPQAPRGGALSPTIPRAQSSKSIGGVSNVTMATNSSIKPLSMLEVLQISADIAAGLAYLHEKPLNADLLNQTVTAILSIYEHEEGVAGSAEHLQKAKIVHRDLKPANILLDRYGRAKISDFGLARQHHSTTVQTVHLGAGTLPYMAPELLVGRHAGPYAQYATNKVDIYSLAMLMWEMVSGQMPWTGMTEMEILAAVTSGRRPHLPGTENDMGGGGSQSGRQRTNRSFSDGPLPFEIDIAQVAAGFDILPQFNQVLAACWQQRETKRPTAVNVQQMLTELLMQFGYGAAAAPAAAPSPSPSPSYRNNNTTFLTPRNGGETGSGLQHNSQQMPPSYNRPGGYNNTHR